MRKKHNRKPHEVRALEENDGASLKCLGPTEGSHRETQNRRAPTRLMEDNMNGLFDAIGSISREPARNELCESFSFFTIIKKTAFCEWMHKFCEDCPAIKRVPATRYTPAKELCPCDFQPFFNGGCERDSEIIDIEIAAENLDELMKGAVAL